MNTYTKPFFDNYLETHFAQNLDMSEKRFSKEEDQFKRNILDLLPLDSEEPILEVGFGTGYLLKYLLSSGYTRVSGIEISREEYEFVRKNIHMDVHYVEDTVDFFHKHTGIYKVVIMLDVLEHIPKRDSLAFLEALRASLAPEGLFLARVPNAANPLNQDVFGDFTHEVFFTSRSLDQLLQVAGFRSVRVKEWEEESITPLAKLTNVTAPLVHNLLRLVSGLARSSMYLDVPLSRNIYGVAEK